jgi:hypothetical protein
MHSILCGLQTWGFFAAFMPAPPSLPSPPQNPNLIIALVGNKSDLADARQVAEADARAAAAEGGLLYFETSAKNNTHVSEVFDTVADRCVCMEVV